jgi:hypothetical protein
MFDLVFGGAGIHDGFELAFPPVSITCRFVVCELVITGGEARTCKFRSATRHFYLGIKCFHALGEVFLKMTSTVSDLQIGMTYENAMSAS